MDNIFEFTMYFSSFLKDEVFITACPPVGQIQYLDITVDGNSLCVYKFSVTVNPSVSNQKVYDETIPRRKSDKTSVFYRNNWLQSWVIQYTHAFGRVRTIINL